MEIGPAPQRAFRSSHLLAVRTLHSSSGVANEICAASCGTPDLAAASASAIACDGDRTSRITVFNLIPPDGAIEVGEEFVQGREPISSLDIADVEVIAFTGFIVVPNDADPGNDKGQAIPIQVQRARQGLRNFPHDDLGKRLVSVGDSIAGEERRLQGKSVAPVACAVNGSNTLGRRVEPGRPLAPCCTIFEPFREKFFRLQAARGSSPLSRQRKPS